MTRRRAEIVFAGAEAQHMNHVVKQRVIVVTPPFAGRVQHGEATVASALNPNRLLRRSRVFLKAIFIGVMRCFHGWNLRALRRFARAGGGRQSFVTDIF